MTTSRTRKRSAPLKRGGGLAQLAHCCTIFLCYLGGEIFHQVGQLTITSLWSWSDIITNTILWSYIITKVFGGLRSPGQGRGFRDCGDWDQLGHIGLGVDSCKTLSASKDHSTYVEIGNAYILNICHVSVVVVHILLRSIQNEPLMSKWK